MSGYIGNVPVPQVTQTRDTFTATSGQTSFATSGYTPGYLDVYLNGVHLVNGTDYTATNGSDVVLTVGAALNDIVQVVSFSTFNPADQAFTGDFSVDSPTFVVDSTNNRVGVNNASPAQALDVTGNIAVSGTVDGRDVAADGTKLDGIEASADVTDTANVTAAGALMDSEVTNLAAVKAFDPTDYATAAQGALADSALQSSDIGVSVQGYSAVLAGTTASFTTAEETKLSGIETGADVTDTANVTAAGALMDSEVTNLAAVKAFDPTDYATAAQGTLADSAVQPNDSPTFSGGTFTGNVSFGDNDKAIFGAGSDLQIYHDGSNSYITDAGTGDLKIRGAAVSIETGGGNLYFKGDANVASLYHTNLQKLSTTATGVSVTGTVAATAFSGDGSALTGIQAGAGYFQGENGNTGDTTNGKGDIFRTHESTLNTNVTIASGDNSLAAGPLTVASGVTLTVNGNLSIV